MPLLDHFGLVAPIDLIGGEFASLQRIGTAAKDGPVLVIDVEAIAVSGDAALTPPGEHCVYGLCQVCGRRGCGEGRHRRGRHIGAGGATHSPCTDGEQHQCDSCAQDKV